MTALPIPPTLVQDICNRHPLTKFYRNIRRFDIIKFKVSASVTSVAQFPQFPWISRNFPQSPFMSSFFGQAYYCFKEPVRSSSKTTLQYAYMYFLYIKQFSVNILFVGSETNKFNPNLVGNKSSHLFR